MNPLGHLFNFDNKERNPLGHLFDFNNKERNPLSHLFDFDNREMNPLGRIFYINEKEPIGLVFKTIFMKTSSSGGLKGRQEVTSSRRYPKFIIYLKTSLLGELKS